ncbi:hypothetical protein [Rubellicoccus peritrichatus]|uniref:RNA polymerase subunit sigma-24 n=1 Tax=Rubellicoccus peritrichatus TaxID=3080537 RepID=A0AAQ3LBY4_9BACT|nr:hypothetical protein [Puniceicoccus sp. CR14]WOO39334.1 hypothetical protein RZN69_11980 [Puniceicoccus sp. CR14]
MRDSNIPSKKFRSTRWSLVVKSRGEGAEAEQALEDLCQLYWFPLYAWCRRQGLSATDSEDMVQGFFQQLIEKRILDRADAKRGKLRTFLLTVLQRHIKDEQGKANAGRRGGGNVVSFDCAMAEEWYKEEPEGESADHLFDRQWALTILGNSVAKLEETFVKKDKAKLFAAMKPFLNGDGSAAEYETAGTSVGMTQGSFKVAVHRLRTKFREALRAEIMKTQPDGESIDEEIEYLSKVLRGSI